jgi:hypothetical protein
VEEAPTRRASLRAAGYAALLLLLVCTLLVHRFTSRSDADKARARARVVLQTIHRLEASYHEENGTYLPIDRENNADVLKLKDPPGPFRYRVSVTPAGYIGLAEADLDGDGTRETWMIDQTHPEPVCVRRD